MDRKVTKLFKTALKAIRRTEKVSLQELGFRIDSDASHIFKIENGQDITPSTMLKLASALGVTVQFGSFALTGDPTKRKRRKPKV